MPGMKYVWKIMVRNAPNEAVLRQGYALAGSMSEALELAGQLNAVAVPQVGKVWSGPEDRNFFLSRTNVL